MMGNCGHEHVPYLRRWNLVAHTSEVQENGIRDHSDERLTVGQREQPIRVAVNDEGRCCDQGWVDLDVVPSGPARKRAGESA